MEYPGTRYHVLLRSRIYSIIHQLREILELLDIGWSPGTGRSDRIRSPWYQSVMSTGGRYWYLYLYLVLDHV